MYGHNVSHSKRRTPRVFKPNLHVARLNVNGQTAKLRLCTKCLRMIKRSMALPTEAQTAAVAALA